MIRSVAIACAIAAAPVIAAAEPKPFAMDPNHSTIHAEWTHTTGTPLLIAFPSFESEILFDPDAIENSSITVTVDTAEAWTGSALWDDHLTGDERPLLRAAEYPTATFTSTSITRTGENTAEMTGDLSIKDQTHPITFDVELKGQASGMGGGTVYGFLATAEIDRTMFGMDMAADIMGADVKLTISSEIAEQAAE